MKNIVILVEGIDNVDPRVTRALARNAQVYNAPRPIYADPVSDNEFSCSDYRWTGDCHHGVMYSVILPDGEDEIENDMRAKRREYNRRQDAYEVVVLSQYYIRVYADNLSRTYDRKISYESASPEEWANMFLDAYFHGDVTLTGELI